MFAIVDIAGQQFKVEKGKSYFVHRLPNATETKMPFDKVLLLHNESDIRVGMPLLEEVSINVKVLEHLKGEKIIVFKKKRRKGYRVKNGHRQCFTKIIVEDIVIDKDVSNKKTAAKKAVVIEQPAEIDSVMENIVTDEVVLEKKTATKKAAVKKAVVDERLTEIKTAEENVTEENNIV